MIEKGEKNMDRIIKSLVEDLLKTQEMTAENEDKDFERFVNYCIISREYNRSFDLEDTLTGSGDDTGIDGIGIIVNGQLMENTEDIDFFINNNKFLEVTFVFTQAKTSSDFSSSEINNFAFGVKDFFAEKHKLRRNKTIQGFIDISNHIFDNAQYLKVNPTCKLFYVTNGVYRSDQNNEAVRKTTITDLDQTKLFSEVNFDIYGSSEITKIYRDSKNTVTTTIIFQAKVTLPEIPLIKESYLGIIPLSELSKLILDENGNVRNIFYDNIRDFEGFNNPVNKGIMETLKGKAPEIFAVLNNGITVVASKLRPSANKFTITDYQIVNGCQTCYVLADYLKNNMESDISLPIKLIITENDEIANRITVATNSQTAIKREQLQAMTEFQKNLELYYSSFKGDNQLFYERRSGQYQSDSNVIKARIINIQNQIKAFSSIFYENPDRVTTYFGSVVKQNVEIEDPKIFNTNHQYQLYYLSGLAYYRLDSLFRSRSIGPRYRKIRFFLLMLFRMILSPKTLEMQYMNSKKKVSQYCDPIIKVLNDKKKTLKVFEKAVEIVNLSKVDIDDKQSIKQTVFTNDLKKAYYKIYKAKE